MPVLLPSPFCRRQDDVPPPRISKGCITAVVLCRRAAVDWNSPLSCCTVSKPLHRRSSLIHHRCSSPWSYPLSPDIKSGHGFVVGDEGYRQDSDIQKVKLSREALTQLSKLVESRVSTGYAGSSSPRIIYLNLSSSGLTGNIASAISNLKSIGYLDLSNNSLTGSVPYFLSQLHSLKVLNLEGNQLTGAVPMQLRENSNNGMFKTSNSNKVVVQLVALLGGGFVILATTITSFFIFKRHRVASEMGNLRAYSRIKMELESNKQQFSYAEVQKITKNFKRVVGKGASGTVYHCYVGDTEVAVKMLSPSDSNSAQVYLQFQALFTR
ncbi:putative leucine-rich repeat receptor-like protein kinase At2g19210 [Arachis stenosperma]|uniref:putative leucine-rich repeat receptor-like protein kinase At2g19210 n=1 Tax=Arachis stenosperma TaxID=217475 RepID=UPI0025ABC7E9|nr:putative leucine-rich repeat receptor-like protein kinase At2g19210 [Arachis stenosperma]